MFYKFYLALFICVSLVAGFASTPAMAANELSLRVLLYHRVGQGEYPTTNVTIDQFKAHLDYIEDNGYQVLALSDALERLGRGEALPEGAVAITIDDAYRSFLENGVPLLEAKNFPFTLFHSPMLIGPDYMSKADIRALLQKGLMEFGGHGINHDHMADFSAERLKRELDEELAMIEADYGIRPTIFAYPFGEASLTFMQQVKAAGYQYGFGQHSGVISLQNDHYFLPRFTFNEDFGDLGRLKIALNALPMIVKDQLPHDLTLTANNQNPPAFGFTVLSPPLPENTGLACYISGNNKITDLIQAGQRVEVRFANQFGSGRTRVNCTKPGPTHEKWGLRWYWHGTQFYRPLP